MSSEKQRRAREQERNEGSASGPSNRPKTDINSLNADRPEKHPCPRCGESHSRIVDSRPGKDTIVRKRRYRCSSCNHRFNTFEVFEPAGGLPMGGRIFVITEKELAMFNAAVHENVDRIFGASNHFFLVSGGR